MPGTEINGEYSMVRRSSLQHIENCLCGTTNEGLAKQVQELGADLDKEALKRFETKGRFYQELDTWLQAAKQIYPMAYAKDVYLKAYFLAVNGGSPYYDCQTCSFQANVNRVARQLETTAASVGLAFEWSEPGNKIHGVIFEVEERNIEIANALAKEAHIGEINRIRLCCRVGMGMLDMLQTFDKWKHPGGIKGKLGGLHKKPCEASGRGD